jgi:hypothetical protein
MNKEFSKGIFFHLAFSSREYQRAKKFEELNLVRNSFCSQVEDSIEFVLLVFQHVTHSSKQVKHIYLIPLRVTLVDSSRLDEVADRSKNCLKKFIASYKSQSREMREKFFNCLFDFNC